MNTQYMVKNQNSTANAIAAVCNFFLPGLGQLIQGRIMSAIFFFLSTTIMYALSFLVLPLFVAIGIHIWAIIDSATYTERQKVVYPRGY